jgi:CheY-like chemotaxis protein
MIALVADDSPTQRALWMYAMSALGANIFPLEDGKPLPSGHDKSSLNVLVARDGMQAALVLESVPVDLLITDVEMPGMDGWQLAARAQQMSLRTPVVVVSSRVNTGERPPQSLDAARTHIIGKIDREQAVEVARNLLQIEARVC